MLKLDSHIDTLHLISKYDDGNFNLEIEREDLTVDVPKLRLSGINACFFALFIKQNCNLDLAKYRLGYLLDLANKVIEKNPSLQLVDTPEEIEQSKSISISLGLENGYPIDRSEMIKYLRCAGIRYITLCHNFSNQICDSSTDSPINNGLSLLGKEIVKEMNKYGIIIDISHTSDQTVLDVINTTELPIVATHSCCYSITNNARNLKDYLIEKIAENNGVIQVTLLKKCVGGNHNIKSLVDHIDHLRRLVGINHIGIGSDFDGGGGLIDCPDIGHINKITNELVIRGYSQEEIEKIWGLNFLRVYKANSGE